ncbi:MAG: putative sulfoacetate--CoA ligase [Candidatus Moanabacter tarae]|uniref:Putative sulfoacetate--CoA ligase n=1 Tax=Candidatus Moanibacter tarae TaxID=2200854 RepID=A0A2Z4ACF6_9BACT|nr:MAG: putative sulfoacetate--CoA ligase [Candidatus Moanabacter tarae]|tara:strand:+ start:186351 stop:187883 length:1533 start_codon:yes stop_codon:yes gene_type:complete
MPKYSTVRKLLSIGEDESVAILGSQRKELTYGNLREQVDETVLSLNKFGIGRNDRVSIVLPNGPEMAMAFVSIASGATTAPLNPAYREEEFEFYLADLQSKALLVEAGSNSSAVNAADKLNIPVLDLVLDDSGPVGRFKIIPRGDFRHSKSDLSGGLASVDDVALVLHTSGTTSRPKIVPLSHRNVCASAEHICETLSLKKRDRCLNVMPLFHIHGLIAGILSSLYAGASVFCTPGFNGLRFFSWLEEAKPTWYTAVPTMHQMILSMAGRNQDIIDSHGLRFIRSSSASLPPQVMQRLEEVFSSPVVEAYAMTEAAHQMTCNSLPPGKRKPGTVGRAAGPEVAIMNEEGLFLSIGDVGEVVIKGPNVTSGYENNPIANNEAFKNGWFRTGDQGKLDLDGYLTITGRLKEIINRGGEKISPLEIDDVLMDHPSVEQVVTFAMPHSKLGEEVAVAIVLREGNKAEERDIQTFANERLANFKVPRKVLFLDEIPKGPTGKIQRIGLAEKLGIG